jgi:peptidoglycan/LPS O-acetylase OafA/YrhL
MAGASAGADVAGKGAGWRADIDGLRGGAVLAVVGFHYFPAWVQGGFVGVDVFFVISGYLITRILLARSGARDAGMLAFYVRRIRRIFPALALLLVAVLGAGWFCLHADEYARLGSHAAAGAGFVSNLLLWRESGYFDASTDTKPLAHLWSLGVEEQFYILWPLLLWKVRGHRQAAWLLTALMLASFSAGVLMLQLDRVTAFYVPLFRFWELIVGGLLAVAVQARVASAWICRRSDLLSVTGLALLATSLATIHSGSTFPGTWALLPVLGTVMLIAAGPAGLCNRLLLSRRALAGVGLISFPLYLWHWPLLVFARTVFNAHPAPAGMLFLLTVAFLLAFLTYRLAEVPLRAAPRPARNAAFLAGSVALLGATGWFIAQADGLPERITQSRAIVPDVRSQASPYAVEGCRLSDPAARASVKHCLRDFRGTERYALVGDSKAEALANGLLRTSSEAGRWLFIGGALNEGALVPVLSQDRRFHGSQGPARLALDTVARNPEIEIVAITTATRALFQLHQEDTLAELPDSGNYALASDGLKAFVRELLLADKRVVLVVDNPALPDPRKCLGRARFIPPQPFAAWFRAEAPPSGCHVSVEEHRRFAAQYERGCSVVGSATGAMSG